MATELRAGRIAALTAALACAATLAVVLSSRLNNPARPTEPVRCEPMPSNVVKLGAALAPRDAAAAPANEFGWPELREKLRPGDRIHPFETAVTGGHLALRGTCYLGATTAWLR